MHWLRRLLAGAAVAGAWLAALPARAHDLPFSHIELHLSRAGIEATVEATAIDLAHDLPTITPAMLLAPAEASQQKELLAAILSSRLILEVNGEKLRGELRGIEPVSDRKNIRLRLHYAWRKLPSDLRVRCRLFPYDPRHKTFLDIYQGDSLEHQWIFNESTEQIEYPLRSAPQKPTDVIQQFVYEGVHHIFIGPDHILFVIGLLLLGGTLKQLLKIISAFTIAHSITLTLATLNVLNPPGRIIEPAIAASIVFVGVHSLLVSKEKRDMRLLFAFCFGLIHGFGFASALHEMDLPRSALVWSLFSFNFGVEIGQACIVLTVAPLLALLRARAKPCITRRILMAGSLAVIVVGAIWFVQRVIE